MMKKRERNWKNILKGMVGLFLIVVLVSCDDDDPVDVEQFDEEEAFTTFNEATFFDDRDIDNDVLFDDNEFNEAFFDAFDLNDNNFIEEDELINSRENFRANPAFTFDDLDANADARLDMTEFEPDFDTNNFFTGFDADADDFISPREFSDGVFVRWDADNDGIIEANTFNTRFDMHFGPL